MIYGERATLDAPFARKPKELSGVPVSLFDRDGKKIITLRAEKQDALELTIGMTHLCSLDSSASKPDAIVAIVAQLAVPAVIAGRDNPLDEHWRSDVGTERVAYVYSNPFAIALASDRNYKSFCAQ